MTTLPRRTTTSQEDDDAEGYQPAEHAEQEIRAQAAQGKANRIFSGARAGDGPSGTGAQVTGDAARRQRFRGLVTSNVRPLGTAADVAQAIAGQLHFIRSAGVHEDRSSSYPGSGFARDFATTDGERVRVEALTRRQFADLAKTTRLARTFAFLERVLDADFSARGDLYTHRVVIGALLAPWFARHTVAELAAVFARTSVQWAHLHIPAGSSRGPADTSRAARHWQDAPTRPQHMNVACTRPLASCGGPAGRAVAGGDLAPGHARRHNWASAGNCQLRRFPGSAKSLDCRTLTTQPCITAVRAQAETAVGDRLLP